MMLLARIAAMPRQRKALLQKSDASNTVPYWASMQKAVMMLGVLNVTSADPTSFRRMKPPVCSFLDKPFVVTAEIQTKSKLSPYTLAIAKTITLQEYPKYF